MIQHRNFVKSVLPADSSEPSKLETQKEDSKNLKEVKPEVIEEPVKIPEPQSAASRVSTSHRKKSIKPEVQDGSPKSVRPIMKLKTLTIEDYGREFDTLETEKHVPDIEQSDDETSDVSDEEDNTNVIFSLKQLKEIIRLEISSDPISKRVQKWSDNDIRFKELFDEYNEKLNTIRENCRDTFRWVQRDMTATNKHISNGQDNLDTTRDDLNRIIQTNIDKIAKLNTQSKELNDSKNEILTK